MLQTVEVGGQIADAHAGRARHPLDRSEEAAHHPYARVLQQRVGPEEQARVEHDVLEVRALAQRFEKPHGLACGETGDHGIAGVDEPYGGCGVEPRGLGHGHPSTPRCSSNATVP